MKNFNVIIWDSNNKTFKTYDIIPYFINCFKKQVENHKKYPKRGYWNVPKTFEEFKRFIDSEGHYQFWSRCEYEIIISDWPGQKNKRKIDVWDQIKINLDLITEIVMQECGQ